MQCSKSSWVSRAKEGCKADDMSISTRTVPLYAVPTKGEAIEDCRWHNCQDHTTIHYPIQIDLYI